MRSIRLRLVIDAIVLDAGNLGPILPMEFRVQGTLAVIHGGDAAGYFTCRTSAERCKDMCEQHVGNSTANVLYFINEVELNDPKGD